MGPTPARCTRRRPGWSTARRRPSSWRPRAMTGSARRASRTSSRRCGTHRLDNGLTIGDEAHWGGPPTGRPASRPQRSQGAGMSQANVQVVEEFEDAFVRGDIERVLQLVSPDVVVHEAPSLPYPGDHHGHDGFLALTDAFNSVWEIVSDLDITFLDGDETRVIAIVAYDVITRPTGVPLRLRMVEVYTVVGGQ